MKNVRKKIGIIILSASIGGLSTLSAQESGGLSAAELLEEGVYLQEAEGDLDKAIAIYRLIIEQDEVTRTYAAEAQFRLATCLLKQGDRLKATEAFEALVAKFPDQDKWSEAALDYMPGELQPLPAPWAESERLKLKWTMNGQPFGQSFMTTTSVQREGRDLWMVDHQMNVGGPRHTQALFDKENSDTVFSHWNMGILGIIDSSYGENEIEVQADGSDEPKHYPVSATVYDNEQVASLFRQMPLEIGYSEQINIFVPLSGQTMPVEVKVAEIETIATGIGDLECYRVDIPLVRQSLWYSVDEHRYLAKLQAGELSAILDEVSIIDPSKIKTVANDRIGLRCEIPQDWETRTSIPTPDNGRVFFYFLDPGFEADLRIFALIGDTEADPSNAGLMAVAEKLIARWKRELKNFEVDDGSLSIEEVGPRKTVVFTGTHTRGEALQLIRFTGFFEGDKKLFLSIKHPDGERNEEFKRAYEIVLNSMDID